MAPQRALRDEKAVQPAAVAHAALAQHLEGHLAPLRARGGEVHRAEALVVGLLENLEALHHAARREVVGGAPLVHGAEARLCLAVAQHDGVGEGLVQVVAHGALGQGAGVAVATHRCVGAHVVGAQAQKVFGQPTEGVQVKEPLELGAEDFSGCDGGHGCHGAVATPRPAGDDGCLLGGRDTTHSRS
jgi:hypothetical protein